MAKKKKRSDGPFRFVEENGKVKDLWRENVKFIFISLAVMLVTAPINIIKGPVVLGEEMSLWLLIVAVSSTFYSLAFWIFLLSLINLFQVPRRGASPEAFTLLQKETE